MGPTASQLPSAPSRELRGAALSVAGRTGALWSEIGLFFLGVGLCRSLLGLLTDLLRCLPLWLLGVVLLSGGCGYSTRGLYYDNIKTVSVPIFVNNGLRRNIEFELTERVIKKIEAKTPYKVVTSEDADTELRGTIDGLIKGPYGEDPVGNPYGGVLQLTVSVVWVDKHTGKVLNQTRKGLSITTIEPFALDIAQSMASATSNSFDRMAEDIVTLLQQPW